MGAPRRSPPGHLKTLRLPAVAMLAAALCSGCWVTAKQGDEMRTAAEGRDQRIAQLEDQARMSQEQLAGKIAQLEDVLERATKVLHRSSADVGAQVEGLMQQQGAIEGQIAELQHALQQLTRETAEKRVALEAQLAELATAKRGVQLKAEEIPADPPSHFATAYDVYKKGDYERARALFRAYVQRHPKDAKAGNAQYWIAATYTQKNKPATALGEYRKVISQHGDSGAVNVALYGMGDAFYRLHACSDAQDALKALLKRKPKKGLRQRTDALIKAIKGASAGYCTS